MAPVFSAVCKNQISTMIYNFDQEEDGNLRTGKISRDFQELRHCDR